MAELPRYEAQIKQTQADVSHAIQGVRASTAGQVMLEQSLTDKLSNFFETSRQIAEPILAKKAEKAAIAEFRAAGDKEVKDMGLMESYGFTAYRDAYNKRLHELTLVRAKNDIKRHADKLELDYEDDPVGYKNAFDSFASSYIDKVPAYLKPIAYEYTETLKTSSMDVVAKKHIEKMKQIELAETNNFLRDTMISATNAAYRNDNESASKFRIEHFNKIDEQIADKIITPEQGRQAKEKFDSSVRENVFVSAMDRTIDSGNIEGAVAYLNSFEEGTYKEFSTFERDAIAAKMRQRLNAAISRQDAEKKKNLSAYERLVKDTMFVLDNDKQPDNMTLAFQAAQFVDSMKEGSNLVEQFSNSAAKNKIRSGIKFLTPREMDYQITQLERKEKFTKPEVELLEELKNLKGKTEKMLDNDPLQLGRDLGITSQTDIRSVPARQNEVNIVNAHYGVTSTPAMTAEELDLFKENLEQADFATKTDMVASIAQYDKTTARATYSKLSEKGMGGYAMSGYHMIEGRRDVARNIMQGMETVKANPSILSKEVAPTLAIKINSAIQDAEGYDMEAITKSVQYYYASRMMQEDVNTPFLAELLGRGAAEGEVMMNEDILDEAISKVIGTPMSRNDKTFFAPIGTEIDDFNDWVGDITNDDIKKMGGISGVSEENWIPAVKNAKLINKGEGTYILKFGGKYLSDDNGNPFILRYGGK